MTQSDFKLPGASLEEVEKIVEAYAQKTGPVSNADIAQLVDSATATVSRCNGFLVSVGLIQGGQKKEATELGRKLGLALHHGQEEEVARFWQEAVVANEFLSERVTAVRVQKAVKKEDLPGKIHYASGQNKNSYMETGSRTVAEILVKSGLLTDENGTYTVSKGASPKAPKTSEDGAVVESVVKEPPASVAEVKPSRPQGFDYQLAVNLQIQIQEFEDTSKYEDLFKALRKHLLETSEE